MDEKKIKIIVRVYLQNGEGGITDLTAPSYDIADGVVYLIWGDKKSIAIPLWRVHEIRWEKGG